MTSDGASNAERAHRRASRRARARDRRRGATGTIARANPSRSASVSRRIAPGTWRISPASPISPITTVPGAGADVGPRPRDRERDGEVGGGLGDSDPAGDADVDVAVRPERHRRAAGAPPSSSASRAGRCRSRPGAGSCPSGEPRRRGPAPRRAADGRPRGPASRSIPASRRSGPTRNNAEGSGTSTRPGSVISSRPSSWVDPNRCLSAWRYRNAWCRSPVNESTVSTTCSSVRGPARLPVLRDVPDQEGRDRTFFGETHQPVRTRAHLRQRARDARRFAVGDGLDRVDRDDVGRDRLDVGEHVLERRVGDEQQLGRERSQPLGAQSHLLGRLLGADEQAPHPRAGEAAERLQQQRALAHAGLAADEGDRAGDEAAAEHPIELVDARRAPGGPGGVDVGDRQRGREVDGRPIGAAGPAARRRGHDLHETPPRPAFRTAPEPPRDLGPALGAPVDGPGSHGPYRLTGV